MQILSKKMLIPMAAVAVMGAGVYGVSQVSAASSPTSPRETLVQKIAGTFHLDQSKVQAVFDQNRADNQASRETNYEARLTQAVTDGKLTAAQKAAVLTEHNKLEAEQQAAAGKTGTDRRSAMQSMRQEAKTWATQNNIDLKWLMGPGRLRGGMGGPMGAAPDATPTPSPTAQ